MSGRNRLYVALATALTLIVGTRLPRPDLLWIGPFLALAGFVIYVAILRGRAAPSSTWTRLGAVATVVLLLVPPASGALLAFLPGLVPAAAALVFLHYLLVRPEEPAPAVDDAERDRVVTREQIVVTAALAAVVVLPHLVTLLPDRLAALYALRSSATPLIVATIVAAPLLLVAGLRHVAQTERDSSRTGPATEQEGSR